MKIKKRFMLFHQKMMKIYCDTTHFRIVFLKTKEPGWKDICLVFLIAILRRENLHLPLHTIL